jgi:hypothetical protein
LSSNSRPPASARTVTEPANQAPRSEAEFRDTPEEMSDAPDGAGAKRPLGTPFRIPREVWLLLAGLLVGVCALFIVLFVVGILFGCCLLPPP